MICRLLRPKLEEITMTRFSKWQLALLMLIASISGAYAQTLDKILAFPSSIAGGHKVWVSVWLTDKAPKDGVNIELTCSDSSLVTIPSTVTVRRRRMSVEFVAQTQAVTESTDVTITATLDGESVETTLTLEPLEITDFELERDTVMGGGTVKAIIALNGDAPEGGIVVSLASDDASVTVPDTVAIDEGTHCVKFDITTTAVASDTTVTLTAVDPNGISLSYVLTVEPLQLTGLFIDRNPLHGGNSAKGMVSLNGPAPTGGVTITLVSDNAAVTVPASIIIPEGCSRAKFTVTTSAVSESTTANVTATDPNGVFQTVTVTVTPLAIRDIRIDPRMVRGGQKARGYLSLDGPAPTGGFVITLVSNNTAVTVPATVTVAAGKFLAMFTVKTTSVSSKTVVTVTATDPNGVVKTATLTVK
jgi:hypothetical protein